VSSRPTASAVLVPVFRDAGGELRLLLVERGSRGIHGGQLGLPGGKQEPEDESLLETALRETEEEVGLSRDRIEVLTPLDPLDTYVSGFRVHPFLARVDPPPEWRPAPDEIAAVVTPTVRSLADPSARYERELSAPTWLTPRRVDSVLLEGGQVLWGVTLRLLDSLLPRLLAEEWPL
jgi:8-oxo-dGTP pyrophosphatase MutT (NUDIX family)